MRARRRSHIQHVIELRGHRIPFRVQRSRTRPIRVNVRGDDGIVVTANHHTSLSEIEQALSQHQRWLLNRFHELEHARGQLYDGSGKPRTLFRGSWISIDLLENIQEVFYSGVGALCVPTSSPSRQIREWYRRQAREEFQSLSTHLAGEMGVAYSTLQIRSQKSRWGSFSSRGTLSLNWRLVMAPPEIYRYVIVHELAHARHMNHSPQFWQIVAAFCPNYRDHIQWLKGHRLLLELLATFRHLKARQKLR